MKLPLENIPTIPMAKHVLITEGMVVLLKEEMTKRQLDQFAKELGSLFHQIKFLTVELPPGSN